MFVAQNLPKFEAMVKIKKFPILLYLHIKSFAGAFKSARRVILCAIDFPHALAASCSLQQLAILCVIFFRLDDLQ